MEVVLRSATTAAASSMTLLSFPTGQCLDLCNPTFLLPSLSHTVRASLTTTLSGRALRDGELFEIVIQKMVDRWSGSIEAGKGHLCVCVCVFPDILSMFVFYLSHFPPC